VGKWGYDLKIPETKAFGFLLTPTPASSKIKSQRERSNIQEQVNGDRRTLFELKL